MKKKLMFSTVLTLLTLMISGCFGIETVFDEAREGAFESTAQGMTKAAETAYYRYSLELEEGDENPDVWYVFKETGTNVYIKEGANFTTNGAPDMFNYSGNAPDNGVIHVTAMGEIKIWFHDGEYCAVKTIDEVEPTVTKKELTLCQGDLPLSDFE